MLIVYYLSILLCLAGFFLGVQKTKLMFRKEFPNTKLDRTPWPDLALVYLKFGVIIICPIINTALGIMMLFTMDDICEKTMDSLRAKYSNR